MMCFGGGVGRSMDFPSVCPSVTQCALQLTRDLGNIAQLSNAKINKCSNFHISADAAMRRAAQKFIKLIGRHEPRAWCSEK